MEKTIRWVLIGIVALFAIKAFFNNSLSRKAEVELTRLKSERDQAFKAIGEHQARIEALKKDTADLAALINLTYQDIERKESALKRLEYENKKKNVSDINVLRYIDSRMDSIFKVRYPHPDSIVAYRFKPGGVINLLTAPNVDFITTPGYSNGIAKPGIKYKLTTGTVH
jgi:hypothetical protein